VWKILHIIEGHAELTGWYWVYLSTNR